MSSLKLCQLGSLVYPVMLTQEAGEISEAKAAELLGQNVMAYRETKATAIQSIIKMLDTLPSPLSLLLESTKGQQS